MNSYIALGTLYVGIDGAAITDYVKVNSVDWDGDCTINFHTETPILNWNDDLTENENISFVVLTDLTKAAALGDYSFAAGYATKTSTNNQFVVGQYNTDNEDALFIVGKGSSTKRENALEVLANGDVKATGNLYENGLTLSEKYQFKNRIGQETIVNYGTPFSTTEVTPTTELYFNTNLSVEEVKQLLAPLPFDAYVPTSSADCGNVEVFYDEGGLESES
jgi:hypothetical protein